MKIKLIYSDDIGLLNFEIKKITSPKNFFSWIGEKDNLFNDLIQSNIFNTNSTYIVKNFDVLTSLSRWNEDKTLITEIANLKDDLELIFICESVKINLSYIENLNIEIVELKKLSRWNISNFINSVCKHFELNLSPNILLHIISNFALDSNLIFHELAKLKSFSADLLQLDTLNNVINFGSENKIFNLITVFLNEDNEKINTALKELENMDEDFHVLFNIFVSQIYLLKLFIECYFITPNFVSIAKKFNLPIFQVTNWSKFIVKYKGNIIDNLINNLLKLEIDVVKNNKNINLAFKLFLINGVESGT